MFKKILIGYCLTISLLIGGMQNGAGNYTGGINLRLWDSEENCEKPVPINHQDAKFISEIAKHVKAAVGFEKKINMKSNMLAVLAGVTVGGLSYFLERMRNAKQRVNTRARSLLKTRFGKISSFVWPVILGTLTTLLSKKFWQYIIGKLNTKERNNLACQRIEIIEEGKGEKRDIEGNRVGAEKLSNPSEIAAGLDYTFRKEGCPSKVNRVLLGFEQARDCKQQHVEAIGSMLREIATPK
jgi:hypothetical protein